MDTFKYVQKDKYKYGEWVINDSPLSQGTERKPCEKGVLRKFIDPTTNLEMTGFSSIPIKLQTAIKMKLIKATTCLGSMKKCSIGLRS